LVAGARADGYSPVDDAISRLAASGAPTRAVMTTGFVCFGIAVPVFAVTARERIGNSAAIAAAVSGLATLGVAAAPLDVSDAIDNLHGAFATIGYISLAAVPALAARTLRVHGFRTLPAVAPFFTLVSAASLAATSFGPAHGLFQRLGLTAIDVWLVAAAISLRRADRPARATCRP
jgi:hypothetical membrane protein